MSLVFFFSYMLFSGIVNATPLDPLTLRIDAVQKYYSAPPLFNPNEVFIINLANIQIYGSSCPAEGCLHQTGVFTYNHTKATTLYIAGAGTATLTMSSYMTYAHDKLDTIGTPNTARNSSFCLDNSDDTYCATDYAGKTGPFIYTAFKKHFPFRTLAVYIKRII